MSDMASAGGEMDEETSLTVVTIPTEHTQAVIDFVAGLEIEETDVSGHMIAGGSLAGIGALGARTIKHRTDTGCVQRKTGVGIDFDCSDSDTIAS